MYLDSYESVFGQRTSGVLFNKFITLLHRDVKRRIGADIQLSHCWYRWGDIVVSQSIPYIQFDHSDLDRTTVVYRGKEPKINNNDEVVQFFKEYIDDFLKEYGENREGVESAIDEVYSDAPYQFQNDYRALRESLRIGKTNNPYSNSDEYILSLLNTAMSSFPEDFSKLEDARMDFEAVFKSSIENMVSTNELFDLAEEFWFYFCYYLRIKCNENVDKETIGMWEDMIPLEDSKYRSSIQNYAYELCPDSGDSRVIALLEQREKRLEEIEKMLEQME